MSAFDSNDPFDNGQQWQSVQTSSATRSWGEAQQEGSQVLRAPQQTTTTTTTTTSSSSRIGSNTQDGEGGGRRVVSSTSSTTSEPTAHESSSSKKSHGHNLVQSLFHSHSKAQTQEQTQGKASSDEQPPSYEASSIDSRPQLHDNYDHLRGPPGQRGVDVKTRIPLESEESGGAGAGSSSQAAAGAGVATAAGVASYGAAHGRSPSSGQQPQGSLRGQRAIGPDQDDEAHARDTDRLLGPNHHDHHHSDSESESDCSDSDAEHGRANGARRKRDDPSHWSVVGKRQAWLSLLYTVLVLVPWAGFCFAWTVLTMLLCILSMLIPPCGYVIVVISVTSWRALARVDLFLSGMLARKRLKKKHPYWAPKIWVSTSSPASSPPPSSSGMVIGAPADGAAHGEHVQGVHPSAASAAAPATNGHGHNNSVSSNGSGACSGHDDHHSSRQRKPVWRRGSRHMKAAMTDRHTVKCLSYFIIWKTFFALPIFIATLFLLGVTLPFMFCLLPTLLMFARMVVDWQFRWAVWWLTEKTDPNVVESRG